MKWNHTESIMGIITFSTVDMVLLHNDDMPDATYINEGYYISYRFLLLNYYHWVFYPLVINIRTEDTLCKTRGSKLHIDPGWNTRMRTDEAVNPMHVEVFMSN